MTRFITDQLHTVVPLPYFSFNQKYLAFCPQVTGFCVDPGPDHNLNLSVQVLKDNTGEWFPFAGQQMAHQSDHTGRDHCLTDEFNVNLPAKRRFRTHRSRHRLKGVFGQVDAHQFLFPAQFFLQWNLDRFQAKILHRYRHALSPKVKHGRLSGFTQALLSLGKRYNPVDVVEQGTTLIQRVEGARLNQAFDDPFVDSAQVTAPAQVFNRLEFAPFIPLGNDGLD